MVSSKGVWWKERKDYWRHANWQKGKGGKKRESGVPNLLETFQSKPTVASDPYPLVDGRRAFQMAVPAAQGLSLAVRE
jgi:hypothetical protein